MAIATKLTRIVKKQKIVETAVKVPDGVDLKLDHEESKALALLLTKVGGSPDDSPRGLIDRIYRALMDAGYHGLEIDAQQENAVFHGIGSIVWVKGTIRDVKGSE